MNMNKTGKLLIGASAISAAMQALDFCGAAYAVVLATGIALICIGRIRGKLKRERESLNFRCRMRRKIAPENE